MIVLPQGVINIEFDDQQEPGAAITMGKRHAKLIYVYLDVNEESN